MCQKSRFFGDYYRDPYLEAFGHVVVLRLQQLLGTGGAQGSFYDGKRSACRYFFRYELPKTAAALALVASRDRTTSDLDSTTLGE